MTLNEKLTERDMKDAVSRLSATYHVPEAAENNWNRYQQTWREVLVGVSRAELLDAIDAYQRTDARFWPTPGALLGIVRRNRDGGTQRPAGAPSNACPVCGATPRLLDAQGHPDANGRADYIHDRRMHEEAGVFFGRFYR